MRPIRAAITCAALIIPTFCTGDELISSNPDMCGTDDIAVMDNGDLVMTRSSIEGIEYLCEFDPLPELSWDKHQILTRTGYCAGRGAFDPQVFAFVFYPQEPGEIEVFDQNGRKGRTVFYACDSLGE